MSYYKKLNTKNSKEGWLVKAECPWPIYTNNIIGTEILFSQIFKDEIYGFSTFKDEPFIIDLGANIGLGVFYWKKKFPKCRIIAVEPSRQVFNILKKNIQANHLSKVTILEKAIWKENIIAEFTADEKISGSLIVEKNLPNSYTVQCITLPEIISEEVDFLKIDIEGAEVEILDQLDNCLDNVRNIFIEYHSFIHKVQNLDKLLAIFSAKGFRYYIQSEYNIRGPLIKRFVSMNQDLQLCIWATRY